MALAARGQRIILTFDKDFGELARRFGLPRGCGVLLLRPPLRPRSDLGQQLARLIASREDWPNHFSVIEPGRVRMRPLSGRPDGPTLATGA